MCRRYMKFGFRADGCSQTVVGQFLMTCAPLATQATVVSSLCTLWMTVHQKLRKLLDLEGMQNFFFRKNGFLLRNMNCIARNYQQTPEIRAKLVFSDMFGHNDFDSNSST